ncbi:MAG: hypothetical protein Q6373_012195 [Candidatus Sigynarchaeota archaeon]
MISVINIANSNYLLWHKEPFMPGDGRDNTAEFPIIYLCTLAYQVVFGLIAAVIDACEGLFCVEDGSGGPMDVLKCAFFPAVHIIVLGVDIAVLAGVWLLRKAFCR